ALFVVVGCYYSEKRFFILVSALWAGLLTGAVLALGQVLGLVEPIRAHYLGFGIVYTLVAMYLIIGILMAAFYFKQATTRQSKIGLILLILAFLFHLTVLEGRSGYLIFILVSPMVARDLMHGFSFKIKALVFGVLVLSLCLSPVVRNRVVYTFDQLKANKEKVLKGKDIKSMPRPYIIKQAIDIMKQHPLIGIGTGSLTEPTRANGHEVAHPHNNFLYMGVSFGMIGFISCFWLFWNMFARSWRFRETPVGYFVFSTCLVLFLGGMFDTQILNTGTLLLLSITYGFLHQLDGASKGNI
ncbi:MAG: O-antigen ligase family protein, partial [Desulfobacteraceae bacterium]|nr:O-antigen ligase family protein [Desulfobacteraceae bacterium]